MNEYHCMSVVTSSNFRASLCVYYTYYTLLCYDCMNKMKKNRASEMRWQREKNEITADVLLPNGIKTIRWI